MMKKIFGCLVMALFVCFVCFIVGINQLNRIFFEHPKKDAQPVSILVQNGESFAALAKDLKEKHVIANAFWFRVAAEFAGVTAKVKQGAYEVTPGENYSSLLTTLTTSSTTDVSVTIPEGYTLKQIGELMHEKLNISAADWQAATGVSSPFESHPLVVMAKKPDNVDLEGYLFPDTYRFYPSATANDVVKKMLDEMQAKIEGIDAPTGDAKGMTLHQVLTLASIVEREVRKPDDMKQVADIFLKRISAGIALQADSTVNYVTGGDDPSINSTDRTLDSPYNTYMNRGLPPGPISNPGLNALSAVIHPASNPYYYFLTDNTGNVYYAKTLEEHTVNRAKYLK